MSNILDKICKYRDVISGNNYEKIVFYKDKFIKLALQLQTQLVKKLSDHDYKLDFTAQDLWEFVDDINKLLRKWDYALDPKRNIRKLMKKGRETHSISLDEYAKETDCYMIYTAQNIQPLYNLKVVASRFAVILYCMEECYNDEFARNYTERLA